VPIGIVGAGNGPIGGDLLASVDLLEAANAADPEDVEAVVNAALAAGCVLVGALPADLAAVALANSPPAGGSSAS
jgi:hypothetical protein